MADIKLFKVGQKVEELKSSVMEQEKKLQTLIEKNMDQFFLGALGGDEAVQPGLQPVRREHPAEPVLDLFRGGFLFERADYGREPRGSELVNRVALIE